MGKAANVFPIFFSLIHLAISDMVRIVKVGNYDECLCIGRHVENISEIGIFRMRFKLVAE